ncbi:MAG: CoB--CoM heterodisulfide reductase iron-sulfur subunit A family protein [Deltaproteobacteria bacterium]|nr:MAG: CoB--CoM heterodisulfide reductase iron-sulfur subunit A family protein [Deltaproteobacteria bacterium]
MYTAKHALLYKHAVPDGQVYVFYIDIRAAGKGHEEFVQKVMSEERILYLRGKVSKIFKSGDKLVVWGADTLSGHQVEIEADLVVLAMAVIPSSGSQKLARTLHIASDLSGFFSEAHPKLRPLESNTDGIFLAGAAQFAKDITDTVSQATGAAGKALSLLANDFISLEPTISGVEEGLCRGCGLCVSICPFGAVKMLPSTRTGAMVAGINPILCKGCGLCTASCLSGAITLKGSSFKQIFAQLEEMV